MAGSIIIGGIFSLFLAIFILLICWSPGKIKGNISEKLYVEINGVKQGMFIKGKDINNPVLLFVHGGPIMPEYFLQEKYPSGLEEYFTICWWEQQGVGLSYNKNVSKENLTIDSVIQDTIEVTNYLRKKFDKEKIYLLGHSWGSFIGIQAASLRPDLYSAYIGMGQVVYQKESEKLAFKYMLDKYTSINKGIFNKLKKLSIEKSDKKLIDYFKSPLRDTAMHKLGIGTMHNMKSVFTGIFLPVMQCRAYTLKEKINIWRGKALVKKNTTLIEDFLFVNVSSKILELKIPCYFVSGLYDYTVCWQLVKEYYKNLKAPIKGFYLFSHSAHSPMFEEPDKFVRIMVEDVLMGKNDLIEEDNKDYYEGE